MYNPAMELQRLRYFVTVAECLNFSTAARQLRLSVPAVSRQVSKLEAELKVELLTRNRRRVVLTHAGELLLREANALLAQADSLEHSLRLVHNGDAGSVRVGFGYGLASSVSPALVEHGQAFPAVEVHCSEIVSDGHEEALRERKIDVGFLRTPIRNAKIRSERIFDERLVVLVNQESPLAKRNPACVRLKELADQPLLLHDRTGSSALYDRTLELFAEARITPKIVYQGPIIQYPVMVAAGKGVFIGAESVHSNSDDPVVALLLDEPNGSIPVEMAWRKDETSAAVLAFLDSARKVFARGETTASARRRNLQEA